MDARSIYMDYQASTPVDLRVIEAMTPYWHECPGNPHATDHAFGWTAAKAVEQACEQVASAIAADPDEIVFTSGATEANNLAILGVAARAPRGRRRIIVSAIEHKSVIAAAHAAAKLNDCKVNVVAVDKEGNVQPDALRQCLADDVLLVSVMAVNNEIGSIQPIADLAEITHSFGALFHTDATQALTAGSFDVQRVDADFASLSAHKLYGPKGIGALYIRRDLHRHVEPQVHGGGQQHGLRAGTLPVPLCVGFGAAIGLLRNADEERQRVRELRDEFVRQLREALPALALNGPRVISRHPGNANLLFPRLDADVLLASLQPHVAASTGSACTSGTIEPSHVLRAIGLTDDEASSSIRFSIGRYTTLDEITHAAVKIAQAVEATNALWRR
ncbi:MAG: cysteine desulfurase IscS [Planctomycetota bacterium]|nr:MAG: cysteine desulfurase IscS [Planctomycetota bacterium]